MNSVLSTLAAAGALALSVTAPAHAGPAETEKAMEAIESVGAGSVNVIVNDEGVATLTGSVGDGSVSNRAVKAVRRTEGVTRVIDLTRTAAE